MQESSPISRFLRSSLLVPLSLLTPVQSAEDGELTKTLHDHRWRWKTEAAFENTMPWTAAYFDTDGTFRTFRGPKKGFECKWELDPGNPTVVRILHNNKAGLSLRFSNNGSSFEAYNTSDTKVGAGGILFPRGMADLPGALDNAESGQKAFRESLKKILSNYGAAKQDKGEDPSMTIYEGSRMDEHDKIVRVRWLMPLDEAEQVLFQKVPLASNFNNVSPGFPNGLTLRTYDVRAGIYNRMTLIVDRADQVVALQLKAQNEYWVPNLPEWKHIGNFPVADFVNTSRKDSVVHVKDLRRAKAGIVVNSAAGGTAGTSTLYLPIPLIHCLLENLKNVD